jgi:ribosome silencing factor RsfS/YbeB/iojap
MTFFSLIRRCSIKIPSLRCRLFSALTSSEWALQRPLYKNLNPISREEIVEFLNEKQANELLVIDTPNSSYSESVIICDVPSTRALRNLAVEMKSFFNGRPTKYIKNDLLEEKTVPGPIVCGLESPDWIAIDFGNVLVHLFLPESRLYYNLEQIWAIEPATDENEELALETVQQEIKNNQ